MRFSIKDFLPQMWPNPQFLVDLVTFIEEILDSELYFYAVKLLQSWKNNNFETLCNSDVIIFGYDSIN